MSPTSPIHHALHLSACSEIAWSLLARWAAMRPPVAGAVGVPLAGLIGVYVLAKLLESVDEAVFHATGEWVSDHSLSHVAAACAALPILGGLRRPALGDNAPIHSAAMG